MRITITVDEGVLERLEARAAREATTVSRLIEDAIRLAAQSHAERAVGQTFKLVTFGKGGRFTSLDVDRTSALIEQDDVARYGRRG